MALTTRAGDGDRHETGKTALVTAATEGLGHESARRPAQEGFTVRLGALDDARGQAAAEQLASGGAVRFVHLDATRDDGSRAAVERITEDSGVLDAMVNDAGLANHEGAGAPATHIELSYVDTEQ
jgi:NAD(P)-dependent dehydrogenase (short-subunit alcohol dehydrogenase family)